MRLRLAFVVLSSVSCITWGVVGCGSSASDDSSNPDAASDGTLPGNDGSSPPMDSGNPGNDGSTGNDGSSGGVSYTCGFGKDAGSVTDCSQCQGATQPCVYCQLDGGAGLMGRCVPENGSCFLQTGTGGFGLCRCSPDAGGCPESFQVCATAQQNQHDCRTCGEQQTNGLTCQGGGTCSQDAGCL